MYNKRTKIILNGEQGNVKHGMVLPRIEDKEAA